MSQRADDACRQFDLVHVAKGFLDEHNSLSVVRPVGPFTEPGDSFDAVWKVVRRAFPLFGSRLVVGGDLKLTPQHRPKQQNHTQRHKSTTPGQGTRPTGTCRPALTRRHLWRHLEKHRDSSSVQPVLPVITHLASENSN